MSQIQEQFQQLNGIGRGTLENGIPFLISINDQKIKIISENTQINSRRCCYFCDHNITTSTHCRKTMSWKCCKSCFGNPYNLRILIEHNGETMCKKGPTRCISCKAILDVRNEIAIEEEADRQLSEELEFLEYILN